jgi:chemotaxis protein MotA
MRIDPPVRAANDAELKTTRRIPILEGDTRGIQTGSSIRSWSECMIFLIGFVIVFGSILGGFAIAGGQIPALFHISELFVVGGTALGTVVVSTPLAVLKAMAADMGTLMKPSAFTRPLYLEGLKMMFELFQTAQRDGLVAIESHIEAPHKSSLLKKYPGVLRQHHAITFLCDSLRLVLIGSVPPHDLEALLDAEIDIHHEQAIRPISAIQKVGDALPGIGIVAAVLGIVVTMGAINGPVEKVGEHVAAALTGTFLGVFLAYGVLGPIATNLEHRKADETRFYHFMKAGVIAVAKGSTPIVAVEFARRSIYSDTRPTFNEMESACKSLKGKRGGQGADAKAA